MKLNYATLHSIFNQTLTKMYCSPNKPHPSPMRETGQFCLKRRAAETTIACEMRTAKVLTKINMKF